MKKIVKQQIQQEKLKELKELALENHHNRDLYTIVKIMYCKNLKELKKLL